MPDLPTVTPLLTDPSDPAGEVRYARIWNAATIGVWTATAVMSLVVVPIAAFGNWRHSVTPLAISSDLGSTQPAPAEKPEILPTTPQPSTPASTPALTPAATPPATTPAPSLPPAPVADLEPEAIVVLTDGQRLDGLLVGQTQREVALRIAGIVTTIPADKVASVTVLPPVAQRFADLRASIDDQDSEQLLALCDWLIRRRRADLAKSELEALLKRQPANALAERALVTAKRQLDLQMKSQAEEVNPSNPGKVDGLGGNDVGGAGDVPGALIGAIDVPLLAPEQINLIKVFEIDLARPPQMVVPRDVIVRVLERNIGHPLVPSTKEGRDAVLRLTPVETLSFMFQLRARDEYGQVKVLGQPESLKRFRDDVHSSFVLNSCATSACHGGAEAGRLVLATRRPNSDPTVYTNFYTLDRFRLADGRPLIDYDNPERSALLQMALPREDSLVKHPMVVSGDQKDVWRPVLRSTNDKRYKDTVAWIRSMYRPRPDYQIDFKPFRPFTAGAASESSPR